MRKTAFLTAALLALLVLPALAVLGPGSGPALARDAQKGKDATTTTGGVSGTIASVQNGVLTVTTEQNRTVSFNTDAYTVVLKGGVASASTLRAGDRVLVNPEFRPIPNGTAKTKPATDPRDDKSATRPPAGSAHPGNNGSGSGQESSAPQPSGERGAPSGQQPNPADNKGVPAGASAPDGPATGSSGASGGRETPGQARARLVWVQQQGELLVYGLVRSVSGGTVVLKTGAQIQATVQVSASTVYARQVPQGAAASYRAGRTDLKNGAHVVVVASGSVARVVLFVTPPPNANSNAGGERK